jgi:hypothetical protein
MQGVPVKRWTWVKKKAEEDGHPFWRGECSDGGVGNIWLSGGDSGDYLTEFGGRFKTLSEAKRAVEAWWDT